MKMRVQHCSETRSLNPPLGIYTSTSVLIARDKRYNVLVKQGRNSYGYLPTKQVTLSPITSAAQILNRNFISTCAHKINCYDSDIQVLFFDH